MNSMKLDLTIACMLADPVIGAAMRADKVDPRQLEDLLRSTARSIDRTRTPKALPLAALAGKAREAIAGSCSRW